MKDPVALSPAWPHLHTVLGIIGNFFPEPVTSKLTPHQCIDVGMKNVKGCKERKKRLNFARNIYCFTFVLCDIYAIRTLCTFKAFTTLTIKTSRVINILTVCSLESCSHVSRGVV